MADVVVKDAKATSPVMLVSAPGFDASGKVVDLARAEGRQLTAVAMGSQEGFSKAEKAINGAFRTGDWVLLKNVHLSAMWLQDLEKKLYGASPHHNYRLFLTMEFSSKIPAKLIRLSRVFVFEAPSGIRASLQRSYAQVLPADRTDRSPVERCRLHFLLAFLHAVVLERMRYAPVGWTKRYEFSDSDQICGRDVIDAWIDSVSQDAQGRQQQNVSPEKIPWNALQEILIQAIYGGRIDNEFDRKVLESFIKHLFCEESFTANFSLNVTPMVLPSEHHLPALEGRKRDGFLQWIDKLPSKGSPAWIGLPVHAEMMLRINLANDTLSKWMSLQGSSGSDTSDKKCDDGHDHKKQMSTNTWLQDLEPKITHMLGGLPEELRQMHRSDDSMRDPLWRCIDREVQVGSFLLIRVRSDLESLQAVCKGNAKMTNELRSLAQILSTDSVPKLWRVYPVLDTISAIEWLNDFVLRLEQLKCLQNCSNFQRFNLWLGGLFFPEAFLTASRQFTAEHLKKSLEEFRLVVDISEADTASSGTLSFSIKGMFMEGAEWRGNQLALTDELYVPMPQVRLSWVHRDSPESNQTTGFLTLPVYLNPGRNMLVTSFKLRAPSHQDVPTAVWLQRSVCLTLWRRR